jgi:alpha-tubulin suppressor-like RCC1 family protein
VNRSGEAGAPPSTDVGPTEVTLPDGASAIGCGADFSCALVDGGVFCWGNDDTAQDRNGDGMRNNSNHQASAAVVGVSNARDLAVGYWHACVAVDGGGVQCWGQNASSELGSGEPCTDVGSCPQRDGSTQTVDVTTATAVAAGLGSSCALEEGGAVRCWGFNVANQLALATGADDVIPSPGAVVASGSALTGITSISSKGTRTFFGSQIRVHTCGLDETGRVLCWGANDHGQSSTVAADMVGVSRSFEIGGAHAVVAGANHSCAIYGADRRVTCWGADDDGQLGDGAAGADTRGPGDRPIADLTDVCSVSAGERHTCATRADGTVWCWGSNADRRLGDTGPATATPRRIVLP